MNFNRSVHLDDFLFVIALLVPAVFAGARYVQADHEITLIAQAQQRSALAADESLRQARLRIASAERPDR